MCVCVCVCGGSGGNTGLTVTALNLRFWGLSLSSCQTALFSEIGQENYNNEQLLLTYDGLCVNINNVRESGSYLLLG